jgi:hypothetical protein
MLGESAYDLIVGALSLLVLIAALCGLAADVIPARPRSGPPKVEGADWGEPERQWVLSPDIEQLLTKTADVTLGQYNKSSKKHALVDDVLQQIRTMRSQSSKST